MIISHLCATRQDIRGSTRALYSDNSRFCLPGKDDNRHILRLRIRIEMSAWVVERKDAGRFAEEYTALYAQIRREKSPNVGREPVFLSGECNHKKRTRIRRRIFSVAWVTRSVPVLQDASRLQCRPRDFLRRERKPRGLSGNVI